jgi:two-component system, chemotaxis family, protein-glutamate methylesterase/glutaminase
MKKLRVLVVEDSLTIRRRFCEILAADPDIDVIGEPKTASGRSSCASCCGPMS